MQRANLGSGLGNKLLVSPFLMTDAYQNEGTVVRGYSNFRLRKESYKIP